MTWVTSFATTPDDQTDIIAYECDWKLFITASFDDSGRVTGIQEFTLCDDHGAKLAKCLRGKLTPPAVSFLDISELLLVAKDYFLFPLPGVAQDEKYLRAKAVVSALEIPAPASN